MRRRVLWISGVTTGQGNNGRIGKKEKTGRTRKGLNHTTVDSKTSSHNLYGGLE
jgi:hypothetical protein